MNTLHLSFLLFAMGCNTTVYSQDSLSDKELISDANLYRNTISTKHINPFLKITRDEFDQRIDVLISTTPFIDKDRFTVELFKINSFIEDEHTILFPEFEFEIPFRFELFDEGMTIIASDSINQKYLLHRIISIENTPWNKIDSLYRTIIKRDNPFYFYFFETFYFHNPELLKGLGVIQDAAIMQFQLLSPAGDTITTIIHSRNRSQLKPLQYASQFKNLLAYSNDRNYWYVYDEKRKLIYFKYKTCSEDKNESFMTFNKKLFQKIEEVKPEKIILDLRQNSGGNSGILSPFIKSIKKSELNNSERFFVLIGRKVMSSSLMNAVALKKSTNATFLGEPTGGNINHFGELKSFTLPNSKTIVTYSTKYWENWKSQHGSFKPDIETTNSLADFLKSYDSALELVMNK